MTESRPATRILGPAGFDPGPYTQRLRHNGFAQFPRQAASWRRTQTRLSPLLFALAYMRHHLRGPDTGGMLSLSEFHLDAYRHAKLWARPDLGQMEVRDAWLASRGSGKSTLWALIIPLWAMAHDHRRFIMLMSDTGSICELHLQSLRQELATNDRLQADFPQLCAPMKTGSSNNKQAYLASSGAAIVSRGLDAGLLGAKIGNTRPDCLIVDDGEGTAARYSMYRKEQRLDTLRTAVLPLNINAPVTIVGTTTRYRSLLHDVMLGEQWAVEERIKLRHYPALITDPETGDQRSSWPARWPLEWLLEQQGRRSFELNFQCAPMNPDGTHWTEDDFIYDSKERLRPHVTAKCLALDPAATSKTTSDQTGLSVVGFVENVRKFLVERATGVRYDPARLREMVHKVLRDDPLIRIVVVEVTNGGEWIEQALNPLPNGLRLLTTRPSESKLARITSLFDLYQRKAVVHARPLPALEQQMLSFPGDHDDIVDSVETAVRTLRSKYAMDLS